VHHRTPKSLLRSSLLADKSFSSHRHLENSELVANAPVYVESVNVEGTVRHDQGGHRHPDPLFKFIK